MANEKYVVLMSIIHIVIAECEQIYFALDHFIFQTCCLQGQPLGFDTKYLALADRNMQVRLSLKVVWEF